jgi:hypothetical protein
MRRRDFVAGGIALAGKAALPASGWAQSAAPRIDRIIDAHCHIFNAADLPIEGFAKKVMVRDRRRAANLSPGSRTIRVPSRRWSTQSPFR